ncbi:hypothetical protein AgCh_016151 [Apium graveolens]
MNTGEEEKSRQMVALNLQKYTKAAQISLRIMAMATTLAAASIVLSSNETVVIYGITANVFRSSKSHCMCFISSIPAALLHHRKNLKINQLFLFLPARFGGNDTSDGWLFRGDSDGIPGTLW